MVSLIEEVSMNTSLSNCKKMFDEYWLLSFFPYLGFLVRQAIIAVRTKGDNSSFNYMTNINEQLYVLS